MSSLLPEHAGTDASSPVRLLPTQLRYSDLTAAKIVNNWTTLGRLIEDEGFPPGKMLGRNTRTWNLDAVVAWLASRPIERKITPRRRNYRKQEK